jgi:hypothetical protein
LARDVLTRGAEETAREYGMNVGDLPDYDEMREMFQVEKEGVLQSPYLQGRREEREFLTEALEGADIRDDLGGRAEEIYDKAETVLKRKNPLGRGAG